MRLPPVASVVVAAALALPPAALHAQLGGAEPRIDSIFARFDNTRSPGCVVSVQHQGQLVFARGYGMADLERGIPLSPESVLRIGSTSKQVTAAAVALLAQDGVLSLDDPVQEHLPELQDFGTSVTLRHMLNMTSGLRDYLTLTDVAGMRDDDYYTDADLLALLARQRELNFPPNTDYLYSNSGYFLMSQIVLRTTGKSLREFAKERIFDPLGMTVTHYHDDYKEIVPNRAMGYRRVPGGFALSMTTLPMTGDGGVFTTVEEWARWNRNFDDPQVGGQPLIATLQTRAVLETNDTLNYALGLRHGTHRGLATVSHSGGFVGFRADHVRYPSEDLAVTCFCNVAQSNPSALAREVAAVLLGNRMTQAQPRAGSAASGDDEAPVPIRPLTDTEAARLGGVFYSQELDVTYRFAHTAERGTTVSFGSRSLPVGMDPDGAYRAGDFLLRPQEATGPVETFLLDVGRVRNLRFVRSEVRR